ncbi:MAG TPA: phosphoribosyl-AMP cyclohydrolase [Rhizomicrobium sp.]|nr:phosphoribosyl-AMP cyclohydrolase [Rhizomicrobium sp.]
MSETLSHAAFLAAVRFDERGLVPAIAQSAATGQVLMMAWMTRETLEVTLATKEVTYWSRSRQKVWRKGETSGHIQRLVDALVDCDGDVLLLKVDQLGPACHTGAPSCFYRQLG